MALHGTAGCRPGHLGATRSPEGLEVLAPPLVQDALGIGELSRLGFGIALPPAAHRVGMEADWLARFARLLGSRGRWTRHTLSAPSRTPGDPERVLGHELVLDNATFRLLGVRPAWTRYLVLDFHLLVAGFWRCRSGENVTDQAMTLNRRVYVMTPQHW